MTSSPTAARCHLPVSIALFVPASYGLVVSALPGRCSSKWSSRVFLLVSAPFCVALVVTALRLQHNEVVALAPLSSLPSTACVVLPPPSDVNIFETIYLPQDRSIAQLRLLSSHSLFGSLVIALSLLPFIHEQVQHWDTRKSRFTRSLPAASACAAV